jgi:ribose-phosphate pyrophosphokinase
MEHIAEGVPMLSLQFIYDGDEDLLHLKFVVDYIRAKFGEYVMIEVHFSYLPYSRMDRINDDYIATLFSVTDFINELNIESIVYDGHSEVIAKRLDSVITHSVVEGLLLTELSKHEKVYIVIPDAGARVRYEGLIIALKTIYKDRVAGIIQCNKVRDFKTGNIIGFSTDYVVEEKYPAVIIDDLCSRGGTFNAVIEELACQGLDDFTLIVGHCENNILTGSLLDNDMLKKVWTTDSIFTESHPKIVVAPLWRKE